MKNTNDPSTVGLMRMEMLGSLVWGEATGAGIWAGMAANVKLEGAGGLIGTCFVLDQDDSGDN